MRISPNSTEAFLLLPSLHVDSGGHSDGPKSKYVKGCEEALKVLKRQDNSLLEIREGWKNLIQEMQLKLSSSSDSYLLISSSVSSLPSSSSRVVVLLVLSCI